MRIGRFSDQAGESFWGVISGDQVHRLPGPFASWASELCHGDGAPDHRPATEAVEDLESLHLLAPAEPTSNIVAVGANYHSHLAELGWDVPPEPLAFLKPHSSVVADGEEVRYPALTDALDYEVELAAVMGCDQVHDRAHASRCVLGFTVANDVSARDLQFRDMGGNRVLDLLSAKAMERSFPLGPWILTPDELGDLDVELTLKVNGTIRQKARTTDMIWDVDELLSYVDARTGLRSGDVVLTGTPGGVALVTGEYLQPGDMMEAEITGIGRLVNAVSPRPRS